MTTLPPGFRFHPTDVELVWYYLRRKAMGKPIILQVIAEVDLYKFAPWDLPERSCLKSRDLEWYFFCPRDKKYANGSRTNRATDIGHWKATGKDRPVVHNSRTIGAKKSLVFHLGRAPHGNRTDWVMYEYTLNDKELLNSGVQQDVYALCKIFQKSGPGPKTGEQYGAPFNDDEWEDVMIMSCVSTPSVGPSGFQANFLEPALHEPIASGMNEAPPTPAFPTLDDGLLKQLEEALMTSPLHPENATTEMSGAVVPQENVEEVSVADAEGIYNGLGDPSSQAQLQPMDGLDFFDTMNNEYGLQSVVSEVQTEQYMEIADIHCLLQSDLSNVPTGMFTNEPFVCYPTFRHPNNVGISTSSVETPVVCDSLLQGRYHADAQPTKFFEMDDYIDQNGWLLDLPDLPQMTAPFYNPDPSGTVYSPQQPGSSSNDSFFSDPSTSNHRPPR